MKAWFYTGTIGIVPGQLWKTITMVGNLGKKNSDSSYRLEGSKNMKKVCVDTNLGSLVRDGVRLK